MFRGLGNVIIWLVAACLLCGCADNNNEKIQEKKKSIAQMSYYIIYDKETEIEYIIALLGKNYQDSG